MPTPYLIPLVGFAGGKYSGKSTAARGLRKRRGYRILSFADPLRKMVKALGIPSPYYTTKKDSVIPGYGCSARHILQTLGTDWGRAQVSETIWLDHMQRRIEALKQKTNWLPCKVVIDDVRFDNEARLIKNLDGLIIKIERGDTPSDSHVSERGISDDLVDIVIENQGTVTDLGLVVEEIVRDRSILSG